MRLLNDDELIVRITADNQIGKGLKAASYELRGFSQQIATSTRMTPAWSQSVVQSANNATAGIRNLHTEAKEARKAFTVLRKEVGLIPGAFALGYASGTRLANMLGTDMQAQTLVMKDLAKGGRAFQSSLDNALASAGNLAYAISSLNFASARSGAREFAADLFALQSKFPWILRVFGVRGVQGPNPFAGPDDLGKPRGGGGYGPATPDSSEILRGLAITKAREWEEYLKLQEEALKKQKKIQGDAAQFAENVADRIFDAFRRNRADLRSQSTELFEQLHVEWLPLTGKTIADAVRESKIEVDRESARKAGEEFANRANAAVEEFGYRFVQPLGDMFASLALDGGRGFGEAAAHYFRQLVAEGAQDLGNLIGGALLGGKITQDEKGNYLVDGKPATQAQIDRMDKLNQGIGFAQIGIGSYTQGQANQGGGQTSGLVGGALAGYQLAGPIGAAIGAIVGWIGATLGEGSARDEYKYGIPTVIGGDAQFTRPKNMNQAEIDQWLSRIQDTVDTFWNGYLRILMKFPTAILPKALEDIDGKFQSNPSKHFLKHLEEWLTGTLPDAIADQFEKGMQNAFVSIGMSADRFNEIWTKFDKLDPRKALELFSMLADAAITMDKVLGWNRMSGAEKMGQLIAEDRNPLFQIQEVDAQILRLAENLGNLTGEAQIRAAQELAQLNQQRMDIEKQLFRDLIALGKEAALSFDAALRGLEFQGLVNPDGTPNISAQMDFLKGQADLLLQQISTSTDPAEIRRLQGEYISTIQQIVGLGSQLGPEYAAAIREWATDALNIGKEAVLDKIAELGAALQTTNDEYRNALEPYWNDFMTKVQDAGDSFDDIGDGIDDVTDVLPDLANGVDRVTRALSVFEQKLLNFNPGGGTSYPDSVARRRLAG